MLHNNKDHQTEDHPSEPPNQAANLVPHKMPAKPITENPKWIDPAALTTFVFFIFFIATVYLNSKS